MSKTLENCLQNTKLSANMRKLSANILSCWNCQLQHSGISAGLVSGGLTIRRRKELYQKTRTLPLNRNICVDSYKGIFVKMSVSLIAYR